MLSPSIRNKIENQFGSSIAYSKDCEALAKSIEKACNEKISITTLKRLFGFAKDVEQPRLYTLNLLASYIGHKDWSSLLANIENTENLFGSSAIKENVKWISPNNIHLLHHQISVSLISEKIDIKKTISLCKQFGKQPEIFSFINEMIGIAARQKNILFLKRVFNLPLLFNETVHSSLEFYYLGQTMGLMLRSHPDIAEELIESLASSKNAQQYFIEWFVDEDYLQGYYGKFLDAYSRFKHVKAQDKLFYFSLKYKQAAQEGNSIHCINWYKKIKKINITTEMHHIPVARYTGICLSEETSHRFDPTSTYYKIIHEFGYANDYESSVGFIFYLCRELFRSQCKDWLVQVITDFENQHGKKITKSSRHWVIKIENQLLIYKAYSYYLLGESKKARQYFSKIDSNLFDPFMYQQMYNDYINVSEKLKSN